MQKTRYRKTLSLILCLVLIAASALCTSGCANNVAAPGPENVVIYETATELGEGSTTFPVTVTDLEGNQYDFTIHTDKTIVGEALEEVGLLSGEEGPYGLYIHAVNGITADYDTDGTYWAFYINDTPATTGVDGAEIAPDTSYALKVEKP